MSYKEIWNKHAILREGVVYAVYKDSLGKLTAGIGHLLTAEEKKVFKLGKKVSKEQVDEWFEADSAKAISYALRQAKEIGIETDWFIAALISVNFQLGDFSKVFHGTYPKIVNHEYDEAIEALRKSKWYKQTPVRVEDFIQALQRAKTFKERPLPKTRTMVGGAVSGVAIAGGTIAEATSEIQPLIQYSEIAKYIFVALSLIGVGLMIYARLDDRKKGLR